MPLSFRKIAKGVLSVLLLIIVVSLLGCASGATKSNSNNTSDAKTGKITGKVLASSTIAFKTAFLETLSGTAAVSGAVCTIEGTDKSATTDDQGSFTILDIASGSYIVICKKTASDGKVFAFLKIAEVQTGQTTDIGTIQVTQAGAIQGKATLTDKTDHTGITVYIPGTSMQARTDPAGAFLIKDVPEGAYKLLFEKDGYVTASINNVLVSSGDTTYASDVSLTISTGATGNITIENGKVYSDSRTVTVSINASHEAVLYQVSENPNFIGSVWNPVPLSRSWIFDSDGEKRLYIKFADANGLESAPVSDSIIIDTAPPANPTSTAGYSSSSKTTTLTLGNWYNYSTPYFEWNGASDSSSGVAGYYVYFGTDGTADPATSGIYQTSASYTVNTALTSGSTYYLRIKARDNAGYISSSTYTAFTFQYDSSDPSNTTGSSFINIGAASTHSNVTLTLSATDNTGVTGYCAKESFATPSINDTCWTSITSTTSYSAGATFTLSTGDGVKTVYVWFKDTAENISGVASDSSPPYAPTGVTAATGDAQATISWYPVADATSYNIYWSTTSGVTKTTGTKISNATSPYIHTGRTNGTAYYYVVTAVSDNGEGWESNQLMVIPPQIPIRLPKTSQTTCYDSSGTVIACAGTGQDGDLQKGVAWPDPRFTDNGDGTVTDSLTSLVWTKDGNAPGPAACSPGTIKAWQAALDYVACLNSYGYLGYTDWRLPNINEFKSLVHTGEANTAKWLMSQGFSNVTSDYYWSSTTYALNTGYAWRVDMWGSSIAGERSYGHYVWPVRSGQNELFFGKSIISLPTTGQTTCYHRFGYVIACTGTGQDGDLQKGVAWPDPRFTDNGDGTVTDSLTSLVWTKDGNAPGPAACSPGTIKAWQAALDYVACLNSNSYLGYTDWRLPNINELKSLIHAGEANTARWLYSQGFSVQYNDHSRTTTYWSSTTYAYSMARAWIVNMWEGAMYAYHKSDSGNYVWPVRAGQ